MSFQVYQCHSGLDPFSGSWVGHNPTLNLSFDIGLSDLCHSRFSFPQIRKQQLGWLSCVNKKENHCQGQRFPLGSSRRCTYEEGFLFSFIKHYYLLFHQLFLYFEILHVICLMMLAWRDPENRLNVKTTSAFSFIKTDFEAAKPHR